MTTAGLEFWGSWCRCRRMSPPTTTGREAGNPCTTFVRAYRDGDKAYRVSTDEVSAAVASLCSGHAQAFQGLSAALLVGDSR
jgi:hypothetical protein